MTIIDTDKIQQLLDSDISAYKIEKMTGVTRSNISLYRTKATKILNMNLDKAIKLQKFWEEYKDQNCDQ